MGCFSFICKVCGDPINSDSQSGEGVKLFLIQDGEVLEEKEGDYDSYGRVFNEPHWVNDWHDICDLTFNESPKDGIAAIHTDCWYSNPNIKIPTESSEHDENQGWGRMVRKSATQVKSVFYKKISHISVSNSSFNSNDYWAKKHQETIDKCNELLEMGARLIKELEEKDKIKNQSNESI